MSTDSQTPETPIPATIPGWELAYKADREKMITLDQLEDSLSKLSSIMGGLAYLLEKFVDMHLDILRLEPEEEGFFIMMIETIRMSRDRLAELAPAVPNILVKYVPAAKAST